MHPHKPPRTVYHGTDSDFDTFDIATCLGAHFGTRLAAVDRLRSTGRLRVEFEVYADDDAWWVREQNWSNRPAFEHGPFDTEDDARCFVLTAPRERQPIAFEIDVYRPLEMPDLGVWTFEAVVSHMRRFLRDEVPDVELAWDAWNRSTQAGWDRLKQAIVDAGFDCIAYVNETEDAGSISWIVMDPEKIHKAWTPNQDRPASERMRERMRA